MKHHFATVSDENPGMFPHIKKLK